MVSEQIDLLDDHALALRLAAGDVDAFEVIYDRYRGQALRLAMSVTGRGCAAEEATQDAFLSLWRKANDYDPSRGAIKTLLLSIVRNRSIDWLRRETRHERNVEIDDALINALEAAERTEDLVVDRAESRHTRQLLANLPSEQRQVLELTYFKGLTHSEIAGEIGIPLGTVKGRQRLALTKLHRTLTSASNPIHLT